jgi:hypothetical protein
MKRASAEAKRGDRQGRRGISVDLYAKLIQNLIYGPIRQEPRYTSLWLRPKEFPTCV